MIAQYATDADTFNWLAWIGSIAVVGGLIGALIGSARDQTAAGLFLGALLGPIGWVIVFVMEPGEGARQRKLMEQAQAYAMAQQYGAQLLAPPVPASWQPDPMGRFPQRWWNGSAWTADVFDGATIGSDPI